MDEPIPRQLNERTGRHRCIRCLAEVEAALYLQNDFLCDACADDGFPLASTPEPTTAAGAQDEGRKRGRSGDP
jgi:hypothetical protein